MASSSFASSDPKILLGVGVEPGRRPVKYTPRPGGLPLIGDLAQVLAPVRELVVVVREGHDRVGDLAVRGDEARAERPARTA